VLSQISLENWINIGTVLGGLILGTLSAYAIIKKGISDLKKKETLEADIGRNNFQKHAIVHDYITALRILTGSDKVEIGQFHNGGKFLDGSPMKKFSITHESCDRGVAFTFSSMQNVLTTIFYDLIELIKEDDPRIVLTQTMSESSSTRTHNLSRSVEAFSVLPIKKGELFAGYIRIEWSNLSSIPSNHSLFSKEFKEYRSFIELELIKGGA